MPNQRSGAQADPGYNGADPPFDDGGVFGLGHRRPSRPILGQLLPHEPDPTPIRRPSPPRHARTGHEAGISVEQLLLIGCLLAVIAAIFIAAATR